MKLLLTIPLALLTWIPTSNSIENYTTIDCFGCAIECDPVECKHEAEVSLSNGDVPNGCNFDSYDQCDWIFYFPFVPPGDELCDCTESLSDSTVYVRGRLKKTGTGNSWDPCPNNGGSSSQCDDRLCKFGWKFSYKFWDNDNISASHCANDPVVYWSVYEGAQLVCSGSEGSDDNPPAYDVWTTPADCKVTPTNWDCDQPVDTAPIQNLTGTVYFGIDTGKEYVGGNCNGAFLYSDLAEIALKIGCAACNGSPD